MKTKMNNVRQLYVGLFAFIGMSLLSACSLQLVAEFDPRTVVALESIDKKIDRLYLTMKMLPKEQRSYSKFAATYLDIDVDIRALQRRQQVRSLNEESMKQVDILAEFWQQDIKAHKQKDGLSDFLINRRVDQYQRLISTIIAGEMAKK